MEEGSRLRVSGYERNDILFRFMLCALYMMAIDVLRGQIVTRLFEGWEDLLINLVGVGSIGRGAD